MFRGSIRTCRRKWNGSICAFAIAGIRSTCCLLHGLDVGPILKTSVPVSQVALGLITIFILCWFAGVLIAGIYNLGVRLGKQ